MTQFLHDFYGGHDPELERIITELEPLSGHAGIDIGFASKLRLELRELFASLKLDPKDTTAKELYFALLAKASYDDERFAKKLGLKQNVSESKSASAVSELLNKATAKQTVFVPKRSVLKRLLKDNPPKTALKLLHYRSFDSMYKRCSMTMILAAAELTASQKWQQNFKQALSKLQFSDFEERQIEFVSANVKHWQGLQSKLVGKSGHSVYAVKAAGGVLIVPGTGSCSPGQTLLFAVAGLRAAARLRILASLGKRALIDRSLQANYSDVLHAKVKPGVIKLRSVEVHWRHQHRLMASNQDILEFFEPNLSHDHVKHHAPEELLNKATNSLKFWQSTSCLGLIENRMVVSANLFDVLLNLVYNRPFGKHTATTLRRALKDEIINLYLNQHFVKESLKSKLQSQGAGELLMLNYPEEMDGF